MQERYQRAISIAKLFSQKIRKDLSEEEMKEVIEKNKDYPLDVCATHDYVDANMYMFEAYKEITGKQDSPESDDDCRLWQMSWDIAKTSEFDPE